MHLHVLKSNAEGVKDSLQITSSPPNEVSDSGNRHQAVPKDIQADDWKATDIPRAPLLQLRLLSGLQKTKLYNGENRMSITLIKPSILTSLSEPPEKLYVF